MPNYSPTKLPLTTHGGPATDTSPPFQTHTRNARPFPCKKTSLASRLKIQIAAARTEPTPTSAPVVQDEHSQPGTSPSASSSCPLAGTVAETPVARRLRRQHQHQRSNGRPYITRSNTTEFLRHTGVGADSSPPMSNNSRVPSAGRRRQRRRTGGSRKKECSDERHPSVVDSIDLAISEQRRTVAK